MLHTGQGEARQGQGAGGAGGRPQSRPQALHSWATAPCKGGRGCRTSRPRSTGGSGGPGSGCGTGLQAVAGVEGQRRRPGGAYFMPLRSTWLAAMSMTLMMKAMAKAQIRLLRTHVWRICWLEQAVATRQEHQRDKRGQRSDAIRSRRHCSTWAGPLCTGARGWGRPGAPAPLQTPGSSLALAVGPRQGWDGGVPGVSHSLSTSTGHSAVPRWLSSSVMMMFSMSFMDRCSQKVS